MADNISVSEGSGRIIGADEIGGIVFQRIKLIHGADGTNDGDVANANPLPVKITDGSNAVSIDALGSKKAFAVQLLDASGNQITSFGGTNYTEDAATVANPVGPMLLARRRDTLTAAEVSADGDVIALNATDKGELRIRLDDDSYTFLEDTQSDVATIAAMIHGDGNTPDFGVLIVGSDGSATRLIRTDANGYLLTAQVPSSTATLSNVASSASNVTLLSSNAARLGATIYNDSTQVLYVKLGTTASSSSYTVQIAAGGYYEVPFRYTGRVDGIWASANGNARITELT